MNRADRKRRAKEDERRLAHGIDPASRDPEPTAAMARQVHALLERAKHEENIDAPVKFLQAKVEATVRGMRDIPVACNKGCSHCCHAWVSVTAPEVLFIAKLLRRKSADATIEKVKAAHLATKDYDFALRARHPQPCPLLDRDLCTIYESRPNSCRFAVSMDAALCARALRLLSGENIPTPGRYLMGRGAYEIAMVIALKHAFLPHHYYEFNAALTRALDTSHAEKAWLGGEDIFADVKQDPNDAFSSPTVQLLYKQAFG